MLVESLLQHHEVEACGPNNLLVQMRNNTEEAIYLEVLQGLNVFAELLSFCQFLGAYILDVRLVS